jgi:hypothetical protein
MTRYDRPGVELEFSREALAQSGCCRYVPIVLRLCGVPVQQPVILTVNFERVRKRLADGTPLDDYEPHPRYTAPVRKAFPGYYEYALDLLARAHDQETGTIRIAMTSQSGSMLSHAVFRLDSRQVEPVLAECKGFAHVGLRPSLRSATERDALQGRVPGSAKIAEAPAAVQMRDAVEPGQLQRVPLFPLD